METPKQSKSSTDSVSSSATVRPSNTHRQFITHGGPANMQDGGAIHAATNRSDYSPKNCLDVSTLPKRPTFQRL